MRQSVRMLAAAVMLAAAAAASAPGSPSGIRPGRPPDPLGRQAEVSARQTGPAPGGWGLIRAAETLPAEGARK